jgi:hypothetical protein
MYLAHVGCGVSMTEVGYLFERDRTTVAHAYGLVEDKRDDPDFDYRLNHLERAVSSLIDALSMRQGADEPGRAQTSLDDAASARHLLKGLNEEKVFLRAKGSYVLVSPAAARRQQVRVQPCRLLLAPGLARAQRR